MWYNKQTRELSSVAPWGLGVQISENLFSEYAEIGWEKVNDDFIPPQDIEKVRTIKLDRMKKVVAPEVVYFKAPAFKQQNAALGVYNLDQFDKITSWIHDVRQTVDEKEAAINAASTIEELDGVGVEFKDLLGRAEEIALLSEDKP
ncbi:hypothetical protein SPFL3102_01487 [Sporomusaceae bacterium FL31]|nr:hypothetical protein SPFL3101_03120 [Sporomusaceae bacterium FL31]GCE33679.1 hypothetical protein SPFL3102_01487 [Sporomusaceae bacterium]